MASESVTVIVQQGDNLKAAVRDAPAGATLLLQPGMYACNLVLDRSLTLQGQMGASEVILDGSAGPGPVITIAQPGIDVVIGNLTVARGSAEAGGGVQVRGKCRVVLRDCVLRDNTAEYYGGGGIYAGAGNLTVSRCRIEGNKGNHGGGVLFDNLVQATLEDTTITRNQGKRGGGMRLKEGAQVRCVGCTFAGNELVPGGLGEAIYLGGTMTRQPQLEIQRCTFQRGSGRPPLFHAGTYPGQVRISGSVLPQSMREGVLFEDLGDNQYVAPEGPAAWEGGFALNAAEMLLLLQAFRPPAFVWPDNTYTKASEEEIAAALVQGLDSLEGKGYVKRTPTREVVPLRALNGLIAACAFPDVSLIFRRTGAEGVDEFTAWHMTAQLTAEDSLLPSGEHRLMRVPPGDVPGRLAALLEWADRPAAPGKGYSVASDVLASLSEAFRQGGAEAASRYLQEQGWPAEEAAGAVQALAERTATAVVLAIRPGARDGGLQLGVWETPAGLWLLRFEGAPENRVEMAPAAADEVKEAVAGLAAQAVAMVP